MIIPGASAGRLVNPSLRGASPYRPTDSTDHKYTFSGTSRRDMHIHYNK